MQKVKSIRGVLMPNLRQIREDKNVKRVDLAKSTGLDYTFIWKIEQRGNGVGYQAAHAIADSLGVTVSDLSGIAVNE